MGKQIRKHDRASQVMAQRRSLAELEAQLAQCRLVLCTVVRTMGRVRVSKKDLDAYREGDAVMAQDVGDEVLFTWKQSDMIVPGGVKSGKAAPKESESA